MKYSGRSSIVAPDTIAMGSASQWSATVSNTSDSTEACITLSFTLDRGSLNDQYGVVSRYAHLASFNVRPGQRVRRGDVIAFVGNTGRSTAPHLHYEVWVNDQAQNPIQYILDEYKSFG